MPGRPGNGIYSTALMRCVRRGVHPDQTLDVDEIGRSAHDEAIYIDPGPDDGRHHCVGHAAQHHQTTVLPTHLRRTLSGLRGDQGNLSFGLNDTLLYYSYNPAAGDQPTYWGTSLHPRFGARGHHVLPYPGDTAGLETPVKVGYGNLARNTGYEENTSPATGTSISSIRSIRRATPTLDTARHLLQRAAGGQASLTTALCGDP